MVVDVRDVQTWFILSFSSADEAAGMLMSPSAARLIVHLFTFILRPFVFRDGLVTRGFFSEAPCAMEGKTAHSKRPFADPLLRVPRRCSFPQPSSLCSHSPFGTPP